MIHSHLPIVLCALALQACASRLDEPPATGFDSYRQQTLQLIENHRVFQTADRTAELNWNAPQQWRPNGTPKGGVLLVHGLGDSPWSFHDIDRTLADQGYIVRTVLLPGHGTRPQDMLNVTLAQWQQVVREQAAQLSREVPKVYLGGFSTGANLVLDYAYQHDDIAGLLLFSPAFRSDSAYVWVTPWISWVRPWLAEPDDGVRPMQTPVRYLNVPTNGFAQFHYSSVLARQRLEQKPYGKPVFMVITEHDSVLDTRYVLDSFNQRFTHPGSRLVWYGTSPQAAPQNPRVLARNDYLPELHISQFSHMGLLFSPDNPLYGPQGSQRICWNGQPLPDMARCMAGEPVWYSDWGYQEPGKVHARLTFNPYYQWQSQVMLDVLGQ
ncbi:lysophospholipase [Pseudomonas sp. 21LCFQ02]|uniref:alpha/beta hydrolase n=1 Tax=Pseudomonas sp. 21LCFQ02 TaxID=2957505 RepID=UPI00209B1CD9|nr:alpha/beta fold hydrolase [Pseudomonas sp. 21LCFQ02]MCO8169169.1 lysophospholipase [Pseudomonas sp. 21LCFQ02]